MEPFEMTPHDHVVLAALLHDIGKFWERAEMLGDYRGDEDQKQRDCPLHSKGYRSHLHVLNTRQFCEFLSERLPFLRPAETQRERNADLNWINLAARHHVASSNLEKLIEAADHFASAEREQGSYYEKGIHKRTRLQSILERVSIDGNPRETESRLPLKPLALESASIFPKRSDQFTPPMARTTTEIGNILLSPNVLTEAYQELARGFLGALNAMPSYASCSKEAVRSIVVTLLAQMERFLGCVPAATNILHPDISLYDHLRVTAAIAEGLYLHHEDDGSLDHPSGFRDLDTPKWRLFRQTRGLGRIPARRAVEGRNRRDHRKKPKPCNFRPTA